MMWLWVTIWILILGLNALCSLLSSRFQGKKWKWMRICAVSVALIILCRGVSQEIDAYRSRVFAHVAPSGEILDAKNFPWTVSKATSKEGEVVYVINDRYGDASDVTVVPDVRGLKYTVYNCIDGIGVKFYCSKEQIPRFTIKIRN
jgi:hypothetical protein